MGEAERRRILCLYWVREALPYNKTKDINGGRLHGWVIYDATLQDLREISLDYCRTHAG